MIPLYTFEHVVHWSDWAGQGDIRIACTQEWTAPDWGRMMSAVLVPNNPETGDGGIYRAANGMNYTFTRYCVTCPGCLEKIDAGKPT